MNMERKAIWRKFEVNTGGSCYMNYEFFINNLTAVRNTIKNEYPDVKDKDINIEIEFDEKWDETNIIIGFYSPETDKEYNERIAEEEKERYNEKVAKLNSIRDFLEANPDLKNEFLNNYV
jgi:hypothetical protein